MTSFSSSHLWWTDELLGQLFLTGFNYTRMIFRVKDICKKGSGLCTVFLTLTAWNPSLKLSALYALHHIHSPSFTFRQMICFSLSYPLIRTFIPSFVSSHCTLSVESSVSALPFTPGISTVFSSWESPSINT